MDAGVRLPALTIVVVHGARDDSNALLFVASVATILPRPKNSARPPATRMVDAH
jgi:hypothetical protein